MPGTPFPVSEQGSRVQAERSLSLELKREDPEGSLGPAEATGGGNCEDGGTKEGAGFPCQTPAESCSLPV